MTDAVIGFLRLLAGRADLLASLKVQDKDDVLAAAAELGFTVTENEFDTCVWDAEVRLAQRRNEPFDAHFPLWQTMWGHHYLEYLVTDLLSSLEETGLVTLTVDGRPDNTRASANHGEHTAMESFDLGDFRLQSGATLPGAKLAYKVHGALNAAKDNAILFPSFLGGMPEALEAWIGKGRPLDPSRYCIILPGHFGLPPTSSPSNTPTPYGRGAFPAVTIADDVMAQRRLLTEQFGIEALQLVLGWSVGGLQTYEWAVRYPRMVRRMASIAGAPRPSPWTKLWLRTVTEEPLTTDPAWRNGFYSDAADLQAATRRMGHAAALTLTPDPFYRDGQEMWRPLGFASADDFVVRFWESFWLAQDPGDVVAQARKARAADVAGGGDLAEALGQVTATTAVVAFTGDHMFQPDECRLDAERIGGAKFHEIDSPFGHLATFSLSGQDVKAVDHVLDDLLTT